MITATNALIFIVIRVMTQPVLCKLVSHDSNVEEIALVMTISRFIGATNDYRISGNPKFSTRIRTIARVI